MHRFYCNLPNLTTPFISISDEDEIHHLRHVLRLKKNDSIIIFNGKGEEGAGIIESLDARSVKIKILSTQKHTHQSPTMILACAIPKKGKFELIIEKATELGVDEIIPMKTERSEVIPKNEKIKQKTLRYQTVAINAAKQCQRSTVPIIYPITDFKNTLDQLIKTSHVIMPSLLGQRSPLIETFQKIKEPKTISFLIGPEGDFTPHEYKQAHDKGCLPVTLGKTILKVETAAISVVACANLFYRHE